MKKNILIVFLACLMMLFSACENKNEGTTSTTEGVTKAEQVEYLDDLPETSEYDGVEFRMLAGNPTAESNFLMADPGENATVLQTASYSCAIQLEERYGITMKYKFMDSYAAGHQAFMEEIRTTTLGGAETAYDAVVPGYWYGLTIAKDYYIDLNTLSNLDFSKPYWNQNFNKNVEINDCLYACVGSFGLDSMTGSYGVVFNQNVLNGRGMVSPFTHYDNNEWTLETMLGMAKEVGNADIVGSELYGILLSRQPIDAFYTASDLKIYTVEDGNYKLTKYSETAENLYQTFYTLTKDRVTCKFSAVTEKDQLTALFTEDRALFGCFSLDEIQSFRHMQTDYGVIVYPKYSSEQENYISGTSGGGIFCIPKQARNPEMSALVLEAMSSLFHQKVIPALIEITLEGQSVRDPRSSEMISQIINNVYWDFGFINHTSIGNVAEFGIKIEDGYATMSSWYGGAERAYKKAFETYYNSFLTGE